MIISGPVIISCVNIYDTAPNGEGGYPTTPKGGVGETFVEFTVLTGYGKGFQFYVQIFGRPNPKQDY